MSSLREIVERIIEETGKNKDEVMQLVTEKIDSYGSLVTETGAAMIVARDLGVNVASRSEQEDSAVPSAIAINQLTPSLNNVTILGRLGRIYGEITFQKKDGSGEGVLQSFTVQDKTGTIRCVAWDTKVEDIRNSNCKTGDTVRIINGYTKQGRDGNTEVHIGNRGYIQLNPADINEKDLPAIKISFTKIKDLKGNERDVGLRGKVTQVEKDILEFERKDGTKGQKRSLYFADETGEVIINFWNERADEIKNLKIGTIMEIFGLTAKIRMNGKIELHSTRMSSIQESKDKTDIKIKKEMVVAEQSTIAKEIKIKDIDTENRLITTKGAILSITPLKEFKRNDGSTGKVRNLVISDEVTMRLVLWDENAEKIQDSDINKIIKVTAGYTRKGRYELEIHAGKQTKIELIEPKSGEIKPFQVNFTNIDEIADDMNEANVRGTITNIDPVKEIVTKDNETVELQSFRVADQTGTIRCTCWRNTISKLSNLQPQNNVEIISARVKPNADYPTELVILSQTLIKKIENADMAGLGFVTGSTVAEIEAKQEVTQDIEDLKEGDKVTINATAIQIQDRPFIYNLCPECRKGLSADLTCEKHGKAVDPIKFLLFSFVANDGTGSINVVCKTKLAEQILEMNTKEIDQLIESEQTDRAPYLYLKDKGFENSILKISGEVINNSYLNCLELKADSIHKVDFGAATKDALKSS